MNKLPVFAAVGAVVLVPDYDAGPAKTLTADLGGGVTLSAPDLSGPFPKVPALIVRVLDTDGAMGGLVDVVVLGRAYDPDNGFRFGKDLDPVTVPVPLVSKADAWSSFDAVWPVALKGAS